MPDTYPTLIVELDTGATPSVPSWSNISPYVLSGSIKRGRQSELERFGAGSLNLLLSDETRRFDPTNTAGAYYPNLKPMRRVRVRASFADDNLLSENQASVETDASGWGNTFVTCVIARSTAQAASGVASLSMTGVGGNMQCDTNVGTRASVTAGTTYTAVAEFRAAVTARSVRVNINWFNAAGTNFAATTGSTVADSTSAWTQATVAAAAPANAVTACATVEVLAAATDEVHYVDKALLRSGTSTTWAVGYPTHALFYGYVDGWPKAYESQFGTTCQLTAIDGFQVLARADAQTGGLVFDSATLGLFDTAIFGSDSTTVAFPVELSGARVGRVLDLAKWPSDLRDIDTGKSTLTATGPSGQALGYLQDVEKSEDGFFYIEADGKATFRDRHQRYTLARMTTSQATFSDDGAGLFYSAIATDYSARTVYNDVRRTADGSAVVNRAFASDSADEYGKITSDETLLVTTDAVAKDLANVFLDRYRQPLERFEPLKVTPATGATLATTLFPQALGRKILDRITVEHTPASSGAQKVRDVLIEGIEHSFSDRKWTTTWALSPANTETFLVFDSATLGKFDTAKFAA